MGVEFFPLGFLSVEAESSDNEDELAEAYTGVDWVHQGVISAAAIQESHPILTGQTHSAS